MTTQDDKPFERIEDIEIEGQKLTDVVTTENIRETEAFVANAVIDSPKCWDIFRELHRTAVLAALSTREFVLSVDKNRAYIREHMQDADGFLVRFETLIADLKAHHQRLEVLRGVYADREGDPKPEELDDLFKHAEAYDLVHVRFNTVIHPLMYALYQDLQRECPALVGAPEPTHTGDTHE